MNLPIWLFCIIISASCLVGMMLGTLGFVYILALMGREEEGDG